MATVLLHFHHESAGRPARAEEHPVARFLVTGGCGFIGSHLCAALRARGDAVRVLDDLSTGSETNLAPGAELLRGDVADPEAVRTAMRGVDGCFHLAAIASVERGVQDWIGTHRVNLSGSIAVFDAARPREGRPAIPVVYASSAAVYGDQAALPLTEEAVPRPLSAYGADKLGSEQHARVAGVVHGVPTLGLRFFNVFGPRQDPRSPYSGVISIFCSRLSRGEAVDIYGDGGQTRDFVFVSDVVAALLAGMGAAATAAPVLNVCSGQPTSVLALAETVAALCGVPLELRRRPPRAGEIRHSLGSPARAREALGLPPPVGLREGLAEVIAWERAGRPGLVR
jgi:UDP-glucose 4-epimerase